MEASVKTVIQECVDASHAGAASFGVLVGRLAAVGVESYYADYRARTTTYYVPSGEAYARDLPAPAVAIPTPFDPAALKAAIVGAQSGTVLYPEFMQRSMAAGCVGYHVWIGGRHVTYYGRLGETHVERFPS